MSSSKLLDQVRITARLRHLSLKTEKAYVQHNKRFIFFHDQKHPRDMAAGHIRDHLSHRGVEKSVGKLLRLRNFVRNLFRHLHHFLPARIVSPHLLGEIVAQFAQLVADSTRIVVDVRKAPALVGNE